MNPFAEGFAQQQMNMQQRFMEEARRQRAQQQQQHANVPVGYATVSGPPWDRERPPIKALLHPVLA